MPIADATVEGGRCRLLVELTGSPDPVLAERLRDLAACDRLGGIVVPTDGPIAADLSTATLLAGPAAPAAGTHGVVAAVGDDAETEVRALRRAWGADGILVAEVGVSRHRAMEAGESGADAILFDGPLEAVVDCLVWWQALFVLPAAARATTETLEPLVRAGADFLLVEAATVADDLAARIAVAEDATASREQS